MTASDLITEVSNLVPTLSRPPAKLSRIFMLDYGEEGKFTFKTAASLKKEIANQFNSTWKGIRVFRNAGYGITVKLSD